MQTSKLPIEACERVIDFVPSLAHSPNYDDYDALQSIPTLYACALVCRDWVYRSQHHLFRQVELSTTRQADAFLDIVTYRPHKAQSVELLAIRPHLPPSPSLFNTIASPPGLSNSPTTMSLLDPVLTSNSPASFAYSVPPSSPHQHTFSVLNDKQESLSQPQLGFGGQLVPSNPPMFAESDIQTQNMAEELSIPPCHYNWIYKVLIRLPSLLINLSILRLHNLPTLHPRFIHLVSCFKTVKTLSLRSLSKQSFNEIIQLVNRLPQLRCFHLSLCQWAQPARFFPSKRLRLEKLKWTTTQSVEKDLLNWLGSLQVLSGLNALELWYPADTDDITKFDVILQRCVRSLRYFSLQADVSGHDPFKSISTSSHSELEYFKFRTPPSFPDLIGGFSSRIHHLLSPSLVYIIIGDIMHLDLASLATSPSSWRAIDDALSQPKFIRLKCFMMSVRPSYEGNFDHEILRASFRTILPKCYQRGILWVGKYSHLDGWKALHICEDDERSFSIDELEASYIRV
ncbi:hypothetical protein NLI96_g6752 [Meripilus lineatus]|uniref:F-box domain-containing protein n=1 Tax=Meripilus lineatus TaxID=2056292 RepID=A0AAD5V0B7_9APHY|nr:hypothetical protein NLI96_g6752 [Physisporinus lineatus]